LLLNLIFFHRHTNSPTLFLKLTFTTKRARPWAINLSKGGAGITYWLSCAIQ
jgi:hypothetical protein